MCRGIKSNVMKNRLIYEIFILILQHHFLRTYNFFVFFFFIIFFCGFPKLRVKIVTCDKKEKKDFLNEVVVWKFRKHKITKSDVFFPFKFLPLTRCRCGFARENTKAFGWWMRFSDEFCCKVWFVSDFDWRTSWFFSLFLSLVNQF